MHASSRRNFALHGDMQDAHTRCDAFGIYAHSMLINIEIGPSARASSFPNFARSLTNASVAAYTFYILVHRMLMRHVEGLDKCAISTRFLSYSPTHYAF